MFNKDDIERKIERARSFAQRSLKDKFDDVNEDDYFMFQISKFLLLKESMIKKDSDNNKIYFNVEDNYMYLEAIIYIVDYVRSNGILISNDIEVVITPSYYNSNEKLKSYIRDFHKIRDTIAHGRYDIYSSNGSILLNNTNLKEGEPIDKDTYIIMCTLPIEVLELFSYFFKIPENISNKKEFADFAIEIENTRKKYGYNGKNTYNIYDIFNKHNNNINIVINDLFKFNLSDIKHDKLGKKIYNDLIYNFSKNSKHNIDIVKYRDSDDNIYELAREKEILLRELLEILKTSKKMTPEQKRVVLRKLQQYGLVDLDVNLDSISVKANDQPTQNYVDKLVLVIKEISSIIGIEEKPDEMIKVSSVYNYMQLFLSFKQSSINLKDKTNLGRLKVSRINPRYVDGKKTDYENIILAIRNEVSRFVTDFTDHEDENGNLIKGKLTHYAEHPSLAFRESINKILRDKCEKLLVGLANRNIEIITSIRNSLEHGNVDVLDGNIKLHDQSNQKDSSTINFWCSGSPDDFYEIISSVDLGQVERFSFADFMIEMKDVLGDDLYNKFNGVIESIKKINEETFSEAEEIKESKSKQ